MKTTVFMVLVAGGLSWAKAGHAQEPSSQAHAAEEGLTVRIVGLRNDDGQVLLALYDKDAGFPTQVEKALRTNRVKIEKGKDTVILIRGLPAGEYAVSVVHDENSNQVLDKNFIGIPKEGVGASNNAKGFMGPPKFKDAKFRYAGGKQTIAIKMVYL